MSPSGDIIKPSSMSEDTEETVKQRMMTRSGRSFGVGSAGDSGDLLPVSRTRPSISAVHLASSPPVEREEMQPGSEERSDVASITESWTSTTAEPENPPVSSPPPAAEGAELNNSMSLCDVQSYITTIVGLALKHCFRDYLCS